MTTNLDFLLKLKNAGRQTADEWIKEKYKDLGKQSTFDVDKHFFKQF
jgi:hypothetical protein